MWTKIKIRIAMKIMGRLGFLPIRSIISFENNTLLVDGKPLGKEQAGQLKESARNMLRSTARRFVQDRVRFIAADMALNKALSFEQIFFARAAMWVMDEEEKLYRLIAQEESEPLGLEG